MPEREIRRRAFLQLSAGLAAAGLAGCASPRPTVTRSYAPEPMPETNTFLADMYGEKPNETYPLPAIPYEKIDPRFYRQMVADPTGEKPGTLVVDVGSHFLYRVYEGGQAMRYGVGLGRAGFAWAGRGVIQYKREWPRWKPPNEMVARQPELQQFSIEAGGMDPGLKNPLGARAMYIFQNGEDTLYRIHGSPEWWTIGKSVSSGCVRMINQDVVDLYNRVPNGTPIVVTDLSGGGMVQSQPMQDAQPLPDGQPLPDSQPVRRSPDYMLMGPDGLPLPQPL
ncbi:L,D-transpeptidase [Ensifer sp. NPDC090286]|uniref:L,D-transpeptidase n=1 Tax=Ensifer sp. NPDC090286 TaxID=3363991 RepID=UPI00383A5D21